MTKMETMGERIKRLRIAAGMTQGELGALLGIKNSAVLKYECGMVENMKRTTIKKMADIFNVSPSYLLCFDDDNNKKESPRTDTSLSEKMFWDTFRKLCDENHTSPNRVAKEFGLSSGSVTSWKNGAVPRDTTLKKIADYFSISVEELLGQKEIPRTDPGLSEEEQELIDLFRIVPVDHQRMVLDIIHAAVGK